MIIDANGGSMKYCGRAPGGWRCTRESGHEGPCAAHPHHEELEELSVATQTAALLIDPKVKLPAEVRRFEAAALTEIATLRAGIERMREDAEIGRWILDEARATMDWHTSGVRAGQPALPFAVAARIFRIEKAVRETPRMLYYNRKP
jgi:hypothetical protein